MLVGQKCAKIFDSMDSPSYAWPLEYVWIFEPTPLPPYYIQNAYSVYCVIDTITSHKLVSGYRIITFLRIIPILTRFRLVHFRSKRRMKNFCIFQMRTAEALKCHIFFEKRYYVQGSETKLYPPKKLLM